MWWQTATHGRGSEEGKWRMEWIASTLHTTSEHGVSSITITDAHISAASSRRNWRPRADLNGLVLFAERRNLVSARVPSHFNWPLPHRTRIKATVHWKVQLITLFERSESELSAGKVVIEDLWGENVVVQILFVGQQWTGTAVKRNIRACWASSTSVDNTRSELLLVRDSARLSRVLVW